MMQNLILIAVPLGLALVAGAVSFGMVRHGQALIVVVLMALGAAIGGYIWYLGRQASGWDGIGYAIALALGIVPLLIGLGIGGLVGYVRRRRDEQG